MSDTTPDVAVPTSATPALENVGRGTATALLTIPAGVIAWVVIWGLGYLASIVGAVVAFLALRLYVWGAGRISRVGAVVVLLTTTVTLVLAFLGGIVYDATIGFGDTAGIGQWAALTHPDFWPTFGQVLPEALPSYGKDIAWAVGFGALGSFATLRAAFAAAKPEAAEPVAEPVEEPVAGAPLAPQAGTDVPGTDPRTAPEQV